MADLMSEAHASLVIGPPASLNERARLANQFLSAGEALRKRARRIESGSGSGSR